MVGWIGRGIGGAIGEGDRMLVVVRVRSRRRRRRSDLGRRVFVVVTSGLRMVEESGSIAVALSMKLVYVMRIGLRSVVEGPWFVLVLCFNSAS